MRDMTSLVKVLGELLTKEETNALVTGLLADLPPHVARYCIMNYVIDCPNPSDTADALHDELSFYVNV